MECVSILIPVYNTGKNLNYCLNSIINQTYKNIEIIIIDDGSLDLTSEICDNWARKDKRIKVYHTRNNGVATARNIAIKKATAKYITFIDSDDYVESDFIETMINLQKKYDADIVSCDLSFCYDYNQKLKFGFSKETFLNNITGLEELMYGKSISNGPTCKLFKKELFETLLFPADKIYEDLSIMYKIVSKSKRIITIPDKKYYYYQRNNSITHQRFSEKKLYMLEILNEMKEFMDKNYPQLHDATEYMILSRNLDVATIIPLLNIKYHKLRFKIKKTIRMLRKKVLNNNRTNTYVKILIYFSYFGIIGIKIGKKIEDIIYTLKIRIRKVLNGVE